MMPDNLIEANATVIMNFPGDDDVIIVWTTPKNDPIVLNYAAEEECRFAVAMNMNWNEVLRDLEENIRNGWIVSKWPAEWGDWKRYAQA